MPNDDIVYLLKFASKEAYINDLMDGCLYMNAAGYYHGLPGEQGRSARSVSGVRDGHLRQLALADLLHVRCAGERHC